MFKNFTMIFPEALNSSVNESSVFWHFYLDGLFSDRDLTSRHLSEKNLILHADNLHTWLFVRSTFLSLTDTRYWIFASCQAPAEVSSRSKSVRPFSLLFVAKRRRLENQNSSRDKWSSHARARQWTCIQHASCCYCVSVLLCGTLERAAKVRQFHLFMIPLIGMLAMLEHDLLLIYRRRDVNRV